MNLALQALKRDQQLRIRAAARVYDVAERTRVVAHAAILPPIRVTVPHKRALHFPPPTNHASTHCHREHEYTALHISELVGLVAIGLVG